MPHEHNPKTFNVDRLRAHEIAGQSSMYAPAITGDFVDGITGNFKELYVDGIKHVPKVQFVYGFRFGGDCTKLDYYNAHANNNFIYVNNTGLFASGDHMVINGGGSTEETRLVSGISGDGTTNYIQLYDNLFYDHSTGEQVCDKFGTLRHKSGISGSGCAQTCYDASNLYVEVGDSLEHLGGDMTWYSTGYRDYFVGPSGIDVHVSGLEIHGLLTFIYPNE